MAPTIDFSQVKDLEPVPNGAYTAEICFAQEGTSKQGYDKIDIRWKILGGECEGRQVFDTLAFHPNALFRVKNTLKALGFGPDFKGEIAASDLVGLQAVIVVTTEEGATDPETGEPYPARNRVSRVKPIAASVAGLLG